MVVTNYCRYLYNDTLNNKIFKNAFGFALLFGFFVHFFILSNYLFNHDSVLSVYSNADWLLSQGKWFVTPINAYKGPIALNYLSGAVGIIAASCMGGMLCRIFSIKSVIHARLIGAVVVAFPSIATMMLYTSGDYFNITALMAVLAAYFILKKDRLSVLIGIALLTLSIGAYQAYLGFTASIFVMICIIDLLNTEIKWTDVIKRGLMFIGIIIVCIGIYYLILQIRLNVTGMTLSSYKGISNMESMLMPSVLVKSIHDALRDVVKFFALDYLGVQSKKTAAIYIVVLLSNIILVSFVVFKRKLYQQPARVVLIVILLFICFPLAINIVGVLSSNQSFYYISIFPFVMVFVALPVLFEEIKINEFKSKASKALSIFVAATLIFSCANWFVRNNQAYQKTLYADQNIQSKSIVLIAQIQSDSNFSTGTPVVLVGNAPFEFLVDQGVGAMWDEVDTLGMGLSSAYGMIYSSRVLLAYIQNNIAPNMVFGNSEELVQTHYAEVQELPIYPDAGSIAYIDGCLVVKLGPIT